MYKYETILIFHELNRSFDGAIGNFRRFNYRSKEKEYKDMKGKRSRKPPG